MYKLLFLCTGNYYRSRFAELLFNAMAAKHIVPWQAFSRGLALDKGAHNIGPISPFAIDALHAGKLTLDPSQAQASATAVLESEPRVQAHATASPGSVTVEVKRTIPTVLLRLVGVTTMTVKARATAGPREP